MEATAPAGCRISGEIRCALMSLRAVPLEAHTPLPQQEQTHEHETGQRGARASRNLEKGESGVLPRRVL